MKYALIVLLTLAIPLAALAQKSNVYADAGISFDGPSPGASATYNYSLARRFGLGAGVQGYDFYSILPDSHIFTPAVFADIRFNPRREKKHSFFYFLDLGADFYRHSDVFRRSGNIIYNVPNNNGIYTGLGFGYFRQVIKGGHGVYISLKIISNSYKISEYSMVTGRLYNSVALDATLALSIGFKF